MQRCTEAVFLTLAVLLAPATAWPQQSEEQDVAQVFDESIFLIRDPVVQEELRLSEDQRGAVDRLVAEVNESLFQLRDISWEKASETSGPLAIKIREALETILDRSQGARLRQIVLRVHGLSGVLRSDVVQELELNKRQQQKIRTISQQIRARRTEREKEAPTAKSPDVVAKEVHQDRIEEYRRILAVLGSDQKARLAALLGKKFDVSRVRPMVHNAPELRDVDAWINTQSLSLEQLRGQVVALHFWTFG